jgi:hypothetical protein
MKLKVRVLPLLVIGVPAGLVGCDMLGRASGTTAIGSVAIWYGSGTGGLTYHVVFYDPGTVMEPYHNPNAPQPAYDDAVQAASIQGVFPG